MFATGLFPPTKKSKEYLPHKNIQCLTEKEKGDLTNFLQSNIPLIEKYLLADKTQDVVDDLQPNTPSYFLIKLLNLLPNNPDFKDMHQKLTGEGIQWVNELFMMKIPEAIKNSNISEEDKLQLLDKCRSKLNINFNQYVQPPSVAVKKTLESVNKLPSTVGPNDLSLETFLNQCEQGKCYIQTLSPLAFKQLDIKKLVSLKVSQKDMFELIDNFRYWYFDENVLQLLKYKFQNSKKDLSKIHFLYSKLTIKQLQKLPQYIPVVRQTREYVSNLYQKRYGYLFRQFKTDNQSLTNEQKEKKYNLLIQARKWMSQFEFPSLRSFINQITYQILYLGLLIKKIDLPMFFEYIDNPIQGSSYFNESQQQVWTKNKSKVPYDNFWHGCHNFQSPRVSTNAFIEKYITNYFKETQKPERSVFYKYFDKLKIDEWFVLSSLAKGDNPTQIQNNILDYNRLQQLKNKKELSFAQNSKKVYSTKDPVKLTLNVKNISEITAEIYEISTERHYLSCSSPIQDTIAIDFIQPFKKVTKNVLIRNPFKHETVEFDLSEILEQKKSIYVIDFVGAELYCRAVIRKGAIVCIERFSLAGVQLTFYEEDGTPIKELDVWIQNKKVSVIGKHVLPYRQKSQNVKIVSLKNGFASLHNVVVPTQNYKFQLGYIYDDENFIVGTKAKVLLQARLELNKNPVTLAAIKQTVITVNIVNHQGINSSFDLRNIKWNYKNQYQLEIPIQNNIESITILVKAKVQKYKGFQKINKSLRILNKSPDKNTPSSFFLTKQKDQYLLQILGINSEPKGSVTANVRAELQCGAFIQKQYITNEKGIINLGKLTNVKTIFATSDGCNDYTWQINNIFSQINLPLNMLVQTNQKINLPTYSNFRLDDIQIVKYDQNTCDPLVRDKSMASLQNNRLILNFKQTGKYNLSFLRSSIVVEIVVIQGQVWQRTSQLYQKETSLVHVRYPLAHNFIGLSDKAEISENDGKYKIKCHLNYPQQINRQSVRVHVFASYFKYPSRIQQLRNKYNNQTQTKTYHVETPKTNYLNNQNLSQEHCYIINREKAKKYIGNALNKPKVLLNRTQTKCSNELEGGNDSPIPYNTLLENAKAAAAMGGHYQTLSKQIQSDYNQFNTITSYNGFLKHGSLIIPNLKGDEIQFQVPKYYQNVRVIVTSQSFAIEKQFDLPSTSLLTKNLKHSGLDQNKPGLTMSRNSYKVIKGQTLKVNRNSVWVAIGSQNIFGYTRTQNKLLKGWVLGWQSYDLDKKKQVYSKNICHQLNTFIKYKDFQFFESVVKPFLQNKLVKTIVDLCLLEDDEAVNYLQINRLMLLNPFQKCLLVDYLKKKNKLTQAQALANSLSLFQKSKAYSFQQYQKLFDTAITSNLSEDQQIQPTNNALFQQVHPIEPYPMQYMNEPFEHQYMNNAYNPYNAYQNTFNEAPMMQQQYAPVQTNINSLFSMAPPPSVFGAAPTSTGSFAITNGLVRMPSHPLSQANFARNMLNTPQNRAQIQGQQALLMRQQFKQGFTEIEKTKQYVETTYADMKNPIDSVDHITPSKFWSDLAQHFLYGKTKDFLSQNFIYLKSRAQFTLALAFIPSPSSPKYNIMALQDQIQIVAESSFLVFVKQVKSVQFKKRHDVIVSQNFYDPNDQFRIDADGEKVEKVVTEFVKQKLYGVKTVVTNISQGDLELQILIDIPQGSIPLSSQQYTQIKSQTIQSYSIRSYNIQFYFPSEGTFKMYPSNVSKKGQVIAKAESLGKLIVRNQFISQNLDDLRGIVDSGNSKDVLKFLKQKNIFDSNVFNFQSILWMLKDKQFYKEVIQIMRERLLYNESIWNFSLYHKDLLGLSELLQANQIFKSKSQEEFQIFEYYPLSSKRAHKHLKGQKNQITNKDFKQTYENFLIHYFLKNDPNDPVFIIVFTYYLILQDRIQQAQKFFNRLKSVTKHHNHPQIQCDYISCFLDIYTGYPNFAVARELSSKYIDYPVADWREIFKDVHDLLNAHDKFVYEEDDTRQYEIKFINRGNNLRVLLPEKTSIQLNLFAMNIELFFSSSPFADKNLVLSVQPFKIIKLQSKDRCEENIQKPQDYPDIYVIPVETSAVKSAQLLSPFLWNNDSVKVKLLQDNGAAVVFVDGKPKPGAYCKVYTKSVKGQISFYKDGYTDIQGKFVYAASELSDVDMFSILFKTEKGGVIKKARKPGSGGSFVSPIEGEEIQGKNKNQLFEDED